MSGGGEEKILVPGGKEEEEGGFGCLSVAAVARQRFFPLLLDGVGL